LNRTKGVELDGIYICVSVVSTAAGAASRYVVERQLDPPSPPHVSA